MACLKKYCNYRQKKLHLPLVLVSTTWEHYEADLLKALTYSKKKYSAGYCIFGDIDIESHKEFEENISRKANLKAILPLWGYEREKLAYEIISSGIKAKISVIRKNIMSTKYLGIDYTDKIFSYFKENNIDLLGGKRRISYASL